MRNRITTALRHLFNLLENHAIAVSSKRRTRRESEDRKKNPSRASFHGGISRRQTANWQPRLNMTTSTAAATISIMLRFMKMNGAGNDFVLIDNRAGDIHLERSQIARLCDRHRGV